MSTLSIPDRALAAEPAPVELDVTRHALGMSDDWTLNYSAHARGTPQAMLIFMHGLGVDAGAYSPLAIALARSGMRVVLPS